MTHRILLSARAARELERVPPETRGRVRAAMEALAAEPRRKATKLVAEDAYRLRVGSYRVIFQVDDSAHEVLVTRIKHRREAYRRRWARAPAAPRATRRGARSPRDSITSPSPDPAKEPIPPWP